MAVSSGESQANINALIGEGYTQQQISSFNYGSKLNPNEAQAFRSQFGAPAPSVGQQVQTGIANLGSNQYQFDPNQYLPAIQGQADSIYSPQMAQLEAIRQLQQVSAQDTRIQTEKDFSKRMQQEVESINRRGAFFSGGAIQNEQDIRSSQASALLQQDLQSSAAQFGNYAQQAQLAAEKTQFIQDRLVNSESSAYARWADNRNFSLQALQSQYQVYANERDFARNVFESDRSFDQQEEQFKQNYKINEAQFKMAKEEFNIDMKIKGLSYDQALSKFKSGIANDNTGLFGTTDGKDTLSMMAAMFKMMGGTVKTGGDGGVTTEKPAGPNASFETDFDSETTSSGRVYNTTG